MPFAAAQAAQKTVPDRLHRSDLFAAAQAAQKHFKDRREIGSGFAAAQAAHTAVGPSDSYQWEFAAA